MACVRVKESGLWVVALLVMLLGCGEESGPLVINGCRIEPNTSCQGARLVGANLTSADLAGADLQGAVLQDANLLFADLSGANLSNANLARANMRGVDLTGANLFGANLLGADLQGAVLTEVTWDDAVCPDDTVAAGARGCLDHLVP